MKHSKMIFLLSVLICLLLASCQSKAHPEAEDSQQGPAVVELVQIENSGIKDWKISVEIVQATSTSWSYDLFLQYTGDGNVEQLYMNASDYKAELRTDNFKSGMTINPLALPKNTDPLSLTLNWKINGEEQTGTTYYKISKIALETAS
ncbi:hypothetical protein [Paenibacillus luteus]|uniref:hypothetical protein n=1 Tax=Paenibacillus luteus TaxID=2545753 RepID=UPI001141DC40|nr:hypothetical protein [Paenibacillus luteus]